MDLLIVKLLAIMKFIPPLWIILARIVFIMRIYYIHLSGHAQKKPMVRTGRIYYSFTVRKKEINALGYKFLNVLHNQPIQKLCRGGQVNPNH